MSMITAGGSFASGAACARSADTSASQSGAASAWSRRLAAARNSEIALARYSAERWTQSTALRLSSAATVAVAGVGAGVAAAARVDGAEAQPEARRTASRAAAEACVRMRGTLDRGGKGRV